ncbi:MAG: hypothetical protein PUP93_07660 [Rhizonema sp. NSF051]|nr:hypothetical protein [Rhizonema sp. NSF051]
MSRKSRKALIGITTYGRLEALPFSLPNVYILRSCTFSIRSRLQCTINDIMSLLSLDFRNKTLVQDLSIDTVPKAGGTPILLAPGETDPSVLLEPLDKPVLGICRGLQILIIVSGS